MRRPSRPTCRCRSAACPPAIKELEPVAGWPWTEASLVFKDRVADHTSHHVAAARSSGAAWCRSGRRRPASSAASTSASPRSTASPTTRGATAARSADRRAARPPRSSGGLVSLATGGDGGGSIRIPAGYTGLLGMKGTFGRIPRSPHAYMRPNTVVRRQPVPLGARRGPLLRRLRRRRTRTTRRACPSPGGWEAGLGTHDLAGRRVAIVPALGGVTLEPGVEDRIRAEAKALHRRHRHGRGRPARSSRRTWPPSG